MNFFLIAVLVLGAIGLIAALVPRSSPSTKTHVLLRLLSSCLVPIVVVADLLDVAVWLMHLSRVLTLEASKG